MEELTTISGLPAPAYWSLIDLKRDADGVFQKAWQRLQGEAIMVIETIAQKGDGRNWLHVSVSKPNMRKIPTWEDVATLKRDFVGEHREAYMIFPTKDRYVNIGNVLHLFCCLDEPIGALPHMEGALEGLGLSV